MENELSSAEMIKFTLWVPIKIFIYFGLIYWCLSFLTMGLLDDMFFQFIIFELYLFYPTVVLITIIGMTAISWITPIWKKDLDDNNLYLGFIYTAYFSVIFDIIICLYISEYIGDKYLILLPNVEVITTVILYLIFTGIQYLINKRNKSLEN